MMQTTAPEQSAIAETLPAEAPTRSLLVSRANLRAALAESNADVSDLYVAIIWHDLQKVGAIEAFTPPAIGAEWPGQGGVYEGLVRGSNGEPDYHLILAVDKPVTRLNWTAATGWASGLTVNGLHDFALPTRRESALLFANHQIGQPDTFEREWHWTSKQASAGSAWFQDFSDGYQHDDIKSYKGRARAVRRFIA
jgi:hypothetical protein